MEQVNSKAYALLDLINEKSDYQITREMYATGLFPWNETNKSNANQSNFLKSIANCELFFKFVKT